jgi:RNase adapter protein RapZ
MERRIRFQQLYGKVPAFGEELFDQRLQLANEGVGAFGRKELHMGSLRIVLVTGLSGAGSSQAVKSFEDLGYYCIEHLPPAVLDSTVAALEQSTVSDVAIALDVRGDARLGDAGTAIDRIARTNRARVLFLDADDDMLVRRFSQTRRRHPFAQAGSIREAIDADRRLLAPLRERADLVIDTTNLTHGMLKERIATAFVTDRQVKLGVTFVAFGFKFGLPTDLDLLFDVRFLRNPNYDQALTAKAGDDPAVGAFIEEDPSLAPFLERVTDLIAFLLPCYLAEGKSQLTIGIGCTGGRHRSVYVAGRLANHFEDDARLRVGLEARDLARTTEVAV